MANLTELHWLTAEPRVGRPVEGRVLLVRGTAQHDMFRVRLSCRRQYEVRRSGDDYDLATDTAYDQSREVAPVREDDRWWVRFAFEIPVLAPPSRTDSHLEKDGYTWYLALQPLIEGSIYDEVPETTIHIGPAPDAELRIALDAVETPETRAIIDDIVYKSGKPLPPYARAALTRLSKGELDLTRKAAEFPAKMFKGCLLPIIVLFTIPFVLVMLIGFYLKMREVFTVFTGN